jgi:hypothetical protein
VRTTSGWRGRWRAAAGAGVHDLGMARKVEGGGRSGRHQKGGDQSGQRLERAAPGAARSGGGRSGRRWERPDRAALGVCSHGGDWGGG